MQVSTSKDADTASCLVITKLSDVSERLNSSLATVEN